VAALRFSLPVLSAAAIMVALTAAPALAGDAASAHTSWRGCLGRAYVEGAAFTGRDLAADAALRSCRGEETAYLAALSDSPLLDADDIAQARPDLVARARAALLETVSGPRAVLR